MITLIYGNGEALSPSVFAAIQPHITHWVAADGGAQHVLAHNIIPDVIIGDMDSFTTSEDLEHLVMTDPDQETNDLEKALLYCQKNSRHHIWIAGATGLRVDHTLKNLSVLLQFNPVFSSLRLVDNFGFHWIAAKKEVLTTFAGQPISLMPLCGKSTKITTQGLKYSLQKESLEMGIRDGSSNQALGHQVVIAYESGPLLLSVGHDPK